MSLSADGLFLAVGGPYENMGLGATWVFRYDASSKSYKQLGDKLVANHPESTSKLFLLLLGKVLLQEFVRVCACSLIILLCISFKASP